MTTITIKDGVLAADRQVTQGTMISESMTKITSLGDFHMAFAGSFIIKMAVVEHLPQYEDIMEELLDGKEMVVGSMNISVMFRVPEDHNETLDGFIIANGVIYDTIVKLEEGENLISLLATRIIKDEDPFFAKGGGERFALGAMMAGATAKEAIEIASKVHTGTGGGVDTVKFL